MLGASRFLSGLLLLAAPVAAESLGSQVNEAIDRGVAWALGRQDFDGSFQCGYGVEYPGGPTALAVYALVGSGVDRAHPQIRAALAHLDAVEARRVYNATALILALDAVGGEQNGARVRKLARWLESARTRGGLWNYGPTSPHDSNGPDLSNTQFAVLARRERIGDHDWYREGARWLVQHQSPDGSWGSLLEETCFALLFLKRVTLTALTGAQPELPVKARAVVLDVQPAGPAVPYLRRWRVGESVVAEPTAWQEVRGDATPTTFLQVQRDTDVVLWVRQARAAALVLDGETLWTRAKAESWWDAAPVETKLAADVHTLAVRLSGEGSTGFALQIARRNGAPAPEVWSSLSATGREEEANARSHPERFTFEQLLRLLPVDKDPALTFDRPADLGRVAWTGCSSVPPMWRAQPGEFWWGNFPNPGRTGIVQIQSAGEATRALAIRKVRVPSDASVFRVTVSAEVHASKGKGDCRLRAGVFDGRVHCHCAGPELRIAP